MIRKYAPRLLTAAAATALALSLGVAAQAETSPETPAPETLAQAAKLAPVDHGTFDQLFVRPGADLASYRQVVIAPVEVAIQRDRDDLVLDDRTVRHAKEEFSEKLNRAFGSGRTADSAGPGVAVVEVTVTEFTPNNPLDPRRRPGGFITHSYGIGGAAFQAVVRDSASGEVLAVIADADTGLPLTSNLNVRTEFGDADRFVSRWSERIAGLFNAGSAS
ncbi:DUF3313 family protein [Indioceanicola profundi]|uniref:DUF3313 family protein n=1 Tax=Indioceanicola profundi TaxID=2220096 RepID=UPI000E6AB570|nr:DUF3313 family protein [Indioceanicola profundi]